MNNTYISETFSVIEALDQIDAFTTRMKKFIETKPQYSYSVSIHQNTNLRSNNKWIVKLNVIKNGEGYN